MKKDKTANLYLFDNQLSWLSLKKLKSFEKLKLSKPYSIQDPNQIILLQVVCSENLYYKQFGQNMNLVEQQDQFNPILYHLQKRNIPELIKIMFNRKLSDEYLQRYGRIIKPPFKRNELLKMEKFMAGLTGKEIIQIKGSHPEKIHYHVNTQLEEYLKIRLRNVGQFEVTDRKIVWLQLTEYYQQPQLFDALDQLDLPPDIKNDIKKDVDRTFLSEDLKINICRQQIADKQMKYRQKLTKILQNFVKYNPFVSYCQGMNILVQFLLQQGFDQQQSFFLLKKITEQLLPSDYHSNMSSITAFLLLLCQVIAHTHPQAVKQIKLIVVNNDGQGISYVLAFAFQWFVCLYTNSNIKRDIRRCIFDHFLLHGLPVLLKTALCFFDIIQPSILNTKQLQYFNPLVQKLIRQFDNKELLKQRLNQTYINKDILQLILAKLIPPLQKRKKRECKTACDRRWTMCVQTIQNNIVNGYSHDFFHFKTVGQPKIIQNYLDNKAKNKNYFCIGKHKNKTDNLLIGRMEHTCRPLSGTSQTQDVESNKCSLGFSSEKNSESPSKISEVNKKYDIQQPQKKQLVRNKALQQLYSSNYERQSQMMRSESILFMKQMIQNESFSNLLQILQVQNMNDLFKDCISEVDEEQQNNL